MKCAFYCLMYFIPFIVKYLHTYPKGRIDSNPDYQDVIAEWGKVLTGWDSWDSWEYCSRVVQYVNEYMKR